MRMFENLPIYLTEANHLLAVLEHKKAGVSTNVWLRILHNRALDLGWLLAPVRLGNFHAVQSRLF